MVKVQTLLSRGFIASALIVLAACSGTPPSDPGNMPDTGTAPEPDAPAPTEVAQEPQAPAGGSQEPTGPQEVRDRRLVETALKNARKSMELRLFEDARNEAAFALELDGGNAEAREILQRCGEILGDAPATVGGRFDDFIRRERIAAERDRFKAGREMELGAALLEQGEFGRAVERFERAVVILQFSVHVQADDPLRAEAEQRLEMAKQAREDARTADDQARQAASQQELDRLAREQEIAEELKVQRLLEAANLGFQMGDYQTAVKRVDQALLIDPTNTNALSLRDLADRARHQSNVDLLRNMWKQEWSKTFDELKRSNLPQTQVVRFDEARWSEVAMRAPESFTPPENLTSPEARAITKKLGETRLEHSFAEADLDNWASYYAGVTGVTFFVTPDARDLDVEETTLRDFSLPNMSVAQALSVIKDQTGVAWKVANGIVHLTTPDKASGPAYLAKYAVHELVNGVKSRPGPDLKLKVPGDDSGLFGLDDEDPLPSVVDDGRLQDLIRNNIAPEAWDDTATINYQSGVLLVRASAEIQEQVAKLLSDLRRHVGIQIDVESRFLKVEDNFLEDIGVDWRGLGNQAATGVAGRGLEQNNRQNAGFDDYGQSQQLNPAAPGLIGTGSEPGVFFDDGQDGDLMARTENLFDTSIGGGEDGLTNAGGLSLQYAFLDDTELEVVLRAVSKQERSEEIEAPRLLVYNNTRASMSFLRNISYIRDFDVEIAQAAAVANPVVDVVRDGVTLDVRPVVDADLKFITMELRPTVMSLQLPIPTFTTTLGVGQPISIQLPRVTLQRVRTTVTMPDGGTMMLGGMKLVERSYQESGIPILKDLPGLSFLFSRKGTYIQNKKVLILIRAKIILMEEMEPVVVPMSDVPMVTGG